jgi:hypothetical protein
MFGGMAKAGAAATADIAVTLTTAAQQRRDETWRRDTDPPAAGDGEACALDGGPRPARCCDDFV